MSTMRRSPLRSGSSLAPPLPEVGNRGIDLAHGLDAGRERLPQRLVGKESRYAHKRLSSAWSGSRVARATPAAYELSATFAAYHALLGPNRPGAGSRSI